MVDKNIKLSIVIVDDSYEDHYFIKTALGDFKNILFNDYYNGLDFLNFLEEKSKAPHLEKTMPDIVILDVNMPKLTGFEVFKIVEQKGLKSHMRFYILTTSITERERIQCDQFGLKCFQKPFSIDRFTELLEEMIAEVVK
jgi:CheY-like chemotaxis protein